MVIAKSEPYAKDEVVKLSERYEIYIKTVIDLRLKICSAGSEMHADSEKILLDKGSTQEDLWGGGINLETKEIDFNSFINIRPKQGNTSIEIQDAGRRSEFEILMRHFFKVIL